MFDPFFEQAVREAAADVLEKMFFIRAVGAPAPGESVDPAEITVRLTFEGSPPGWLAVRVNRAAARSIAADFLGEEPESITDQQAEEMVCELANMICGSVLSRTESDAAFRVSSPVVSLPEDLPGASDAVIHRVALGAGVLTILMKAGAAADPLTAKLAS